MWFQGSDFTPSGDNYTTYCLPCRTERFSSICSDRDQHNTVTPSAESLHANKEALFLMYSVVLLIYDLSLSDFMT